MRRLLAALVVLSVAAVAVPAGTAHAGAAAEQAGADGDVAGAERAGAETHGTLVKGTVTTEGGDPASGAYVLVQPAAAPTLERATNGSRSVRRSLLELADDPPREIQVNRTGADGRYTVHLPSQGHYQVIAVTADGEVSRLRNVTIRFRKATRDLRVEADRVQRVRGGAAAGTPGRTTTVTVRVENTDERPLRNLAVSPGELPDGWTVESVETGGTYREGTLRWRRVAAGETVTARVTLSVPEDADLDTYRIPLSASADRHHVVHTGAVRVRVSPPNSTSTPAPTPTPLGGGGVDVSLSTPTPSGSPAGGPFVPLLSVAVFSLGVGVAAFAVGRTGLPYVGD